MAKYKEMRHAYGFDDVALVPGDITINPDQTDLKLTIGDITLDLPFLASAMDGVVDTHFAVALGKMGGLAVLNLDGVQTRYEFAEEVLEKIAKAPDTDVTATLQQVYSEPIKEELIGKRIKAIKAGGVICAVSIVPANTKKYGPIAIEAGADIIVVQSTVTTARHVSKSYKGLQFSELRKLIPARIPIIVGNCVSYNAAIELMQTGIDGLLVGVGPGSACTTREVLGVGVPQVTATIDCSAARDDYLKESGKYVAIITDGGLRTGGDMCKALASGADAVMLGSTFARCKEAAGKGYHWGMATPDVNLPRGTRIRVGVSGTLKKVLFGPTSVTNGTENIVQALKTCLGVCGAHDIKEMHKTEVIIAPSIKTEGKLWQMGCL